MFNVLKTLPGSLVGWAPTTGAQITIHHTASEWLYLVLHVGVNKYSQQMYTVLHKGRIQYVGFTNPCWKIIQSSA
jgi:hypothetical protein